MSPHHGCTSRSNKKSSRSKRLETWRTPSLTSKYWVTASRTDKDDEEVNEGEGKGRTEMQSHDVLPLFPFIASEQHMKPSCSGPAPVRLHLHLYLNWHPRCPHQ